MTTRYDGELRYGNSGAGDVWTTPSDLFEALNARFQFTLDAAADDDNALCTKYYTPADDGLMQAWTGTVFCNPPYSAVKQWTRKAAVEYASGSAVLVCVLVPVRTSTVWWRDAVASGARAVFLPQRLYFGNEGCASGRAGFDSALLVWGCGALHMARCSRCKAWIISSRNDARTCSVACRVAKYRND